MGKRLVRMPGVRAYRLWATPAGRLDPAGYKDAPERRMGGLRGALQALTPKTIWMLVFTGTTVQNKLRARYRENARGLEVFFTKKFYRNSGFYTRKQKVCGRKREISQTPFCKKLNLWLYRSARRRSLAARLPPPLCSSAQTP
jgi:hypothetical protein